MSVAQQNIAQQITYDDLYRRWEEGNWKATELDFTEDKQGWESLSEIQRKSAIWVYSMFFYGEDAVTDGLSPYIEAAPKEEQKYFLATQQVDEARHAVFFHRFFKEVIGVEGDIATGLEATLPELGWGYRNVFGRLERMVEELHTDRSLPKFAQAITLYHMVIEATMAQPTQHFIEDFFVKAGTMPGFSAGMEKVSRDEQRHIGFGVKVLSELFAESDECKAAAVELLREVLPYVTGIFVPPGWDERYTTEYGFTIAELYAWGMRSVEQKWRATGYPLEEHPPGIYPFDPEMAARGARRAADQAAPRRRPRRAERQARGHPEVEEILFDLIARSAHTDAVDRPVTIQWRFEDAEPWHLRIDNGSTSAETGARREPGRHAEDDLGRLDRRLGPRPGRPPGDAAAQDQAAWLAAPARADAEDLPAAPAPGRVAGAFSHREGDWRARGNRSERVPRGLIQRSRCARRLGGTRSPSRPSRPLPRSPAAGSPPAQAAAGKPRVAKTAVSAEGAGAIATAIGTCPGAASQGPWRALSGGFRMTHLHLCALRGLRHAGDPVRPRRRLPVSAGPGPGPGGSRHRASRAG